MSRLELVPTGPRALVLGAGHERSGCTVAATLLSLAAYTAGARVLLVDQALKTPVLQQLLGLPARPATPAAHAIDERFTVVTAGTRGEDLPAAAPIAAALASAADLVVVLAGARRATLAAAATLTASLQPEADLLVLPRDDRVGLAAGYAALKTMAVRLPNARLYATVSRRTDAPGPPPLEGFAGAVATSLGRPCRILPPLPDDPTLPAALAAGLPLAEVLAGSPLLAAAARCWTLLSASPHPSPRAATRSRALVASPA